MEQFTVTDCVDPKLEEALVGALVAETAQKGAPTHTKRALSVVVRDEKGNLTAGLVGTTWWNWLYVKLLWVSADHRGQGLGSKLIKAAEDEARTRGCLGSYVWTETFQASNFYPKLGYKPFVSFPDFPVGHQRVGLMKSLKQAA